MQESMQEKEQGTRQESMQNVAINYARKCSRKEAIN